MSRTEPISNLTKHQKIITKIQNLIKEKGLRTGDRLPPERELAVIFGVNRSSLREAVRILTTLRMLEAKVGSGVYVKDPDLDTSIELLYVQNDMGIGMQEDEIRDTLEMRYMMEMFAVRKICLRQDDAILSRLEMLLEQQKTPYLQGINSEELDRDFHLELARSSGNMLLARLLNTLHNLTIDRRVQYFKDKTRREESYADHKALLENLKARNLNEAETLITLHLRRAASFWGFDGGAKDGGKQLDFN